MRYKPLVVAAVLLSGCASAPSPAEDAAMRKDAVRDVSCAGQNECAVKWGRAVQWVLDNSAFRIQIQTDNLIQTAGPLPDQVELAVVVSKVPLGNDRYRFELRGGCNNMFGCSPSLDYAKAYFVRQVEDNQKYQAWHPVQ